MEGGLGEHLFLYLTTQPPHSTPPPHLQTKVGSQQMKKTTEAAAWPQKVFTHSPFLQIEELFPSLEKKARAFL